MKKALLGLLLLFVVATGCNKDKERCATVITTAPSTEVSTLQAYISSKGITADADSRGFFYTIVRPGSDLHPTICNNVKVNYQGWLTNNQQFDAGNGVSFPLANLIDGWQEGLPLIGEGGSIILYLPPSLGYGAQASTSIPANSITIFQIDLLDVL